MADLDTRMNFKTIIDYKEIYGESKDILFAESLIKGIPSVTLLKYISGFNIKLYLSDTGTESHLIQLQLLNKVLIKAGKPTLEKFDEVIKKHIDRQEWPIVLWRYSNLLFYELIFKNYNTLPDKDFSKEQAKDFLDAYLILNSVTSNRFNITSDEIQDAVSKEEIESIFLPHFIYQKDYASTTEFSNQITRCFKLFEFLENSEKFKDFTKEYYKYLHIKDSKDLIYNLLTIFGQVGINSPIAMRKQIIPLSNLIPSLAVDYIQGLTINDTISAYKTDNSFRTLRNKMLYEYKNYTYLLLDINFLIDQLYKAQIFSFKSFIEKNGYKGNFLSVKGKEFMEDIYFRLIMEKCFPNYIRKSGNDAKKNDGNELCDFYLRKGNEIILIEFKDILLNGDLKEKSDKDALYSALDRKFFENQNNDPKGIKQLYNAIKYIEKNTVNFDYLFENGKPNIYPIVVYTDSSFGYEGINKILKQKLNQLMSSESFEKIIVKEVTFINLSYFELHEDLLKQGIIDLQDYVEEYHKHTKNEKYSTTPFEVFSRFYFRQVKEQVSGNTSFMLEILKQIFPSEINN
ncbi:hypothetical protein EG339_16060 [Chryseobacterium bernardetii]|uniref:Uncharacterized protein n=1 Tax=Chryseobacterium bernardetii TaxID=1241978 RepID=A0A3G6TIB5_9FLAO|nr:hypothetical protein [Chryseobacterium bernardetii]AZB25994.1 hypothetical protein EG339_16060 [Chryseobacterium bernardetii]